jgi:hypothetical protein
MPDPDASSAFDLTMARTLALGVLEAYKKYEDPGHVIYLPGYEVLDQITVFEALGSAGGGSARVSSSCDDPLRTFMGFSATGSPPGSSLGYNNIVVLRGTQSGEEALEDIDWSMTPCLLPTGSKTPRNYGQVSNGVSYFYWGTDDGLVTPLSVCFKRAIANFKEPRPLYIAGHSLGGAVVTLGALDAVVSGIYISSLLPKVYTFASMKIGDASFGQAVAQQGIEVFRVVNLADWVPAFTGIEKDTPGYLPVGLECSFLWQTEGLPNGGDWANHSLRDIYYETLQKFPGVIKFGSRKYPQ